MKHGYGHTDTANNLKKSYNSDKITQGIHDKIHCSSNLFLSIHQN